MTGKTPLPPEEWPEELAHIVADMGGKPINIHRLMANNPSLMRAWWAFRQHSVTGGSLGRVSCELLILRVAVHMGAWYEWAHHVDRGMQVGLPIERIMAVLEPGLDQHWSPAEAALLKAVDELTQAHSVSAPSLKLLERHFDNTQVMDLMAIHGMYLILAHMINTWGLPLEPEVLERVSAHTNEDDFLLAAQNFAEARGDTSPTGEQ